MDEKGIKSCEFESGAHISFEFVSWKALQHEQVDYFLCDRYILCGNIRVSFYCS